MGRRASRVDVNHREIVDGLRKIGASVQSLATVGFGVPDLLVGFRNETFLIEVKKPSKTASERFLNEAQAKWHTQWRGGRVGTVKSILEAFSLIGASGFVENLEKQ